VSGRVTPGLVRDYLDRPMRVSQVAPFTQPRILGILGKRRRPLMVPSTGITKTQHGKTLAPKIRFR